MKEMPLKEMPLKEMLLKEMLLTKKQGLTFWQLLSKKFDLMIIPTPGALRSIARP
ncbi:MAG: hypothetical protein ACFCBU_15790 [Cyanophyceae cyanobacterium]